MAGRSATTRRRRLAAVVAVLWAGYVGVVTTVLWLLDREVSSALLTAAAGGVAWSAMVLVIGHVTGLRHRVAGTQGALEVVLRSPDGHPRLSSG